MKTLELKIFPEPGLRRVAEPVTEFGPALKESIKEMTSIMYINSGIGLAAPQVGLNKRILIIDIGEGLKTFINPEITSFSKELDKMEEGCLSLPDIAVMVSRPEKVTVKAFDVNGSAFEAALDGLTAKAIQHELDHLNGKLLLDYLNPLAKIVAEKRLKMVKKKKIVKRSRNKKILI